ncbi:MAG: glutamine-hydrolyzing carbamoyl-phosphate synthase small subunit [Sphaerochaetaceae bacterium]|nr:glutamine-hydrolyzing carbamoyl-phosphate synthase small subunit [Sphaerochaetaceae bacterium]
MQKGYLLLSDGSLYEGKVFGNDSICCGELVFNTSMTGYPEILTDPSYNGQIVLMTYPLIGNYGVDEEWNESCGINATALVVKKLYEGPLPEGKMSLESFLKKHNRCGITDIDTRALTLHIRRCGSQNAVIYPEGKEEEAKALLSTFPSITERDLIDGVSVKKVTENPSLGEGFIEAPKNPKYNIALADFGVKRSIIENFYRRNASITLLPPDFKSFDVLDKSYDMLFLSNGPGDPALLQNVVAEVKKCIGKIPVCGICLGHQLITWALGGKTVKMTYGHHGGNHPVKDLDTGKTFVTSQNHGFMSDMSTLPESVHLWFINANDNTVEGLYDAYKQVRSVQFHPEAAPGPQDATWIFDKFLEEVE